MSLVLAAIFASAVPGATTTPAGTRTETETPAKVPAAEVAKPADCDSKDKKVEALQSGTKSQEEKTAEEKALANLGLKADQPKTTGTVISGVTPPMETCK